MSCRAYHACRASLSARAAAARPSSTSVRSRPPPRHPHHYRYHHQRGADPSHRRPGPHTTRFESGLTSTALAVGALAATSALVWLTLYPLHADPHPGTDSPLAVMPETRQGWLGNLTNPQEAALRELWEALGKITHMIPPERPSTDSGAATTPDTDASKPAAKKKKRFSMFRRRDSDDGTTAAAADDAAAAPDDDKHGQTREFRQALADQTPEQLRANIWGFCKLDHPDALLLRFLRARKWDVHAALVMLVSTAHWRAAIRLDDELMPRGEAGFACTPPDAPDAKLAADFLAQMRMGKSFLHGVDRQGRPLCYVRVRLHRGGEQGEEALEKFTVYTIETARMMLREPVDTAGIIFDMSSFSMANMDYTPVKFMIKVFEANYPESLGHICVHRAPWVFNTIWHIIKGWLDPVVASKIRFTKDDAELAELVAPERIPKELGGAEDWAYSYVEPRPGEGDAVRTAADSDEFKAAKAERAGLVEQFERLTVQWVKGEAGDDVKAQRQEVAGKLVKNYWRIDPFVRAPSLYDRVGIIQPGGVVDMYADQKKKDGGEGEKAPA